MLDFTTIFFVKIYLYFTIILLMACVQEPVRGQRQGINIENHLSSFDQQGFIKLQGTDLPPKGTWTLSRWNSYSQNSLSYKTKFEEKVIRHRVAGDLIGQVAITNAFAFAFSFESTLYQEFDVRLNQHRKPTFWGGIGDLRVFGRYKFPTPAPGVGLGVLIGVGAPIGDAEIFAGEGTPTSYSQLFSDFQFWKIKIGSTIGWKHRFRERFIGPTQIGDELLYGLGLKFRWSVWSFLGELRGNHRWGQHWNKFLNPHALECEFGVAINIQTIKVILTGGTDVVGNIGVSSFKTQLGLMISSTKPNPFHTRF